MTTKKLFVLDTNVLMHDPSAIFKFEEHDIFLPMIVLEELDGHKTGVSEVARNVRQTNRMLVDLMGTESDKAIKNGIQIPCYGSNPNNNNSGKLFFQTDPLEAKSYS